MTNPTFGISINRIDDEPRPAVGSDLSVIGIVVAADDADTNKFPLNTPVEVFTDDQVALGKMGDGALADAVAGIDAQLGAFEVAARAVVVRVAAGTDNAHKMANVAGSEIGGTGVFALLKAGVALGVIPRLILTPGIAVTSTHETGQANPVVTALTAVLPRLLGHAIVTGPDDNLENWTNWRETIQSDRIIPLASGALVSSGVNAVEADLAPRVAGIAVRRDHEKGGLPFWSWANQPVQGILAPNRDIAYSLTDGACEGQQILAGNGGILVRGQMGVEQAIADSGFVYIGTDNCSDDPLWQFYNITRGRDYIHLMFLRTLRYYLGRFNITNHAIQAIINTMNSALRDLQAQEAILGYKVGFSRDLNSPEQVRLGKFTVSFAAEEAPVLRQLGIQSARYRPAIDALLDTLMQSLSSLA